MNIIFIMADQLSAAFIGCYGSGVDSTPTLDALAERGMRFERCYATVPVCAPNRANFLTGRSPAIHGVFSNNYVLATDMPTYAHVLQAHGYRTGGFGKFHQTPMHFPVPENMAHLGFDESMVTEDPKWGPWIEWIEREYPDHFDDALALCWPMWPSHPRPKHYDRMLAARERILKPLQEASVWEPVYPSPLPPELHDTTFITDRSLDFMQRHLRDHPDRPFFAHVSFVDPHDPYNPPEPYASMFDPADMPRAIPAEWLNQGFETLEKAQHFRGFRDVYENPNVIPRMRALYHGSIRLIDDQIARIVAFLDDHDLWDDTILVFTTDHGDMMGDHLLMTKGVMHYDKSIHCPLIVAGAGVQSGVSERLTCTLDFFPSFCDWAGVDAGDRPPLEGRSFAGATAGQPEPEPRSEISVALESIESVVTDDGWRLTWYAQDQKGQMFNLFEDPEEQHNLYGDPAFAVKRQELFERLAWVMTRPSTIAQYRNMPVLDGRKWPVYGDRMEDGVRIYRNPPAPYL